ncbi:MAG TPA: biotin carboxylase N-terminal domain-containing protein [Polyangiaceae bacterium]|jgi:acetyl-CoA carboxylase biotin carboxylase subunit|nr:biotin carboxylase N-terminal domain-containing protein [Polyangiaceae bacterium]
MFKRVLVANRGEIARRIMRTLREMGIESVAVYSDADKTSSHVRAADRAVHIGPAAAAQSYLSFERLLDAAKTTGSDAIIPGYGFLSENADFAQACQDARLVFIGPKPDAIRRMGSKIGARALMAAAGVPLAPAGKAGTVEEAVASAAQVGFPLLLKASAGGGGRGMRRVDEPSALPAAFQAAQRESERAFGDGSLYLERALSNARHVEVQVVGDEHGNLVNLFERDCSIQRRHQKVVEETPAPLLSEEIRQNLLRTAQLAARQVEYSSVGTIEFLLDHDGRFYFLEMNTRLQVEHAISEMVTGIDLVRQMIRSAYGLPLDFKRDDVKAQGVALECRVCAEDPSRGFLPRTGKIARLVEPGGPFVRVDSGVQQGSIVGSDYDSLLAKVCTWGPTREAAVQRMQRALHEYQIEGVVTNLPFLRKVCQEPDFVAGRYDTSYIGAHPNVIEQTPTSTQLAALAVAGYLNQKPQTRYREMPLSDWYLAGHPKR